MLKEDPSNKKKKKEFCHTELVFTVQMSETSARACMADINTQILRQMQESCLKIWDVI